jgi:hypothetical protein
MPIGNSMFGRYPRLLCALSFWGFLQEGAAHVRVLNGSHETTGRRVNMWRRPATAAQPTPLEESRQENKCKYITRKSPKPQISWQQPHKTNIRIIHVVYRRDWRCVYRLLGTSMLERVQNSRTRSSGAGSPGIWTAPVPFRTPWNRDSLSKATVDYEASRNLGV